MFHEVSIVRSIVDRKGNDKLISEKYLTENKEFLAESEQMLMQEFNGECEVTMVKQSKIKEFVNECTDADEQKIFLVGIEDVFLNEQTGEETATKYVVGLFAKSVEDATRIASNYMSQGMADLRLKSVIESKFVELLK